MATDAKEHPPTSTMNRASGDVAASSQDAQKQMQGQPTAAQEAQGAKPDAGKDCCRQGLLELTDNAEGSDVQSARPIPGASLAAQSTACLSRARDFVQERNGFVQERNIGSSGSRNRARRIVFRTCATSGLVPTFNLGVTSRQYLLGRPE